MESKRNLGAPIVRRFSPIALAAAAILAVNAIASSGATPNTGATSPEAQALFVSSGCGACHVLAVAKTKGTIGPDLDGVTLTQTQIVFQITNGGSKFLTAAMKKVYKFPMTPYKGRLNSVQITNLATWLVKVRNPKAAAAAAAKSQSGATVSSGGAPPPGYSSGGTSTTSYSGGGAAGSGCSPGVTIRSSGNTDADGDELGTEPDDGDGCV